MIGKLTGVTLREESGENIGTIDTLLLTEEAVEEKMLIALSDHFDVVRDEITFDGDRDWKAITDEYKPSFVVPISFDCYNGLPITVERTYIF